MQKRDGLKSQRTPQTSDPISPVHGDGRMVIAEQKFLKRQITSSQDFKKGDRGDTTRLAAVAKYETSKLIYDRSDDEKKAAEKIVNNYKRYGTYRSNRNEQYKIQQYKNRISEYNKIENSNEVIESNKASEHKKKLSENNNKTNELNNNKNENNKVVESIYKADWNNRINENKRKNNEYNNRFIEFNTRNAGRRINFFRKDENNNNNNNRTQKSETFTVVSTTGILSRPSPVQSAKKNRTVKSPTRQCDSSNDKKRKLVVKTVTSHRNMAPRVFKTVAFVDEQNAKKNIVPLKVKIPYWNNEGGCVRDNKSQKQLTTKKKSLESLSSSELEARKRNKFLCRLGGKKQNRKKFVRIIDDTEKDESNAKVQFLPDSCTDYLIPIYESWVNREWTSRPKHEYLTRIVEPNENIKEIDMNDFTFDDIRLEETFTGRIKIKR